MKECSHSTSVEKIVDESSMARLFYAWHRVWQSREQYKIHVLRVNAVIKHITNTVLDIVAPDSS